MGLVGMLLAFVKKDAAEARDEMETVPSDWPSLSLSSSLDCAWEDFGDEEVKPPNKADACFLKLPDLELLRRIGDGIVWVMEVGLMRSECVPPRKGLICTLGEGRGRQRLEREGGANKAVGEGR